jgi:hypothetical protein
MTKQQQFLFIVQTAILANAVNLASSPKTNKTYRHVFSATGVLGTLDDVIHASKHIPKRLTAHAAAHEFCHYMFENLRETNEANGSTIDCPSWFAR